MLLLLYLLQEQLHKSLYLIVVMDIQVLLQLQFRIQLDLEQLLVLKPLQPLQMDPYRQSLSVFNLVLDIQEPTLLLY